MRDNRGLLLYQMNYTNATVAHIYLVNQIK